MVLCLNGDIGVKQCSGLPVRRHWSRQWRSIIIRHNNSHVLQVFETCIISKHLRSAINTAVGLLLLSMPLIHCPMTWAVLCVLACPRIGCFQKIGWSSWPNDYFQAWSPRVAKGRQGSPRVSKVQGGPQGWLRWVRTKSIIFKSFSNMIFKIGPFPHWNPH